MTVIQIKNLHRIKYCRYFVIELNTENERISNPNRKLKRNKTWKSTA
jgi:hypothetical protein